MDRAPASQSYRQTVSSKYSGQAPAPSSGVQGSFPGSDYQVPSPRLPLSDSAAEGVRAQPSPSALELSLCISRIPPLTSFATPPCLLEPWRRGFSHNLSAREDSQHFVAPGSNFSQEVSDNVSVFSSGVSSCVSTLSKIKGLRRSAGSVRSGCRKRPRKKLWEI